jgi:uncharacterized protein YbcI
MTPENESMQAEDALSEHDPSELKQISRAMVRLYKEQFGRGPETVWTRYSGPDCIISILGSSLSPVERRMRDMGEEQRLRDIRVMFQHATEQEFRTAVEDVTGRRVIGFMSGIDVQNDLSSEVFTLEPRHPNGAATTG